MIQRKNRRPIRTQESGSYESKRPHARHVDKGLGTCGNLLDEVGGGGAQWAVGRRQLATDTTDLPPSPKPVTKLLQTYREHPLAPSINMYERGGGKNIDTSCNT